MGKRSSFPRRKADDYATPLKGVMPVIPHLRAEGIVTFVEPCAGAGNLVAHLCSFGFLCAFARDLRDGFDALTCDQNIFQGADAIVTNPPWTRAVLHPMIERFSDILPTWLLFDADWAHTKQAAPYLDYCSHIVAVGRLKWIPGTKHQAKDSCAWHRFDRRHSGGPHFIGRPSHEIAKSYRGGGAMNFHQNLPGLVNRAASQLANAVSAAEVLEARHSASLAYDAAKKAARFAKAKGAHDQLIAAAHRAQADALEIESIAKRRLADEYDAAQERGEVAGPREGDHRRSDRERPPTAADIGLSRKEVHEARIIRDAEKADPRVVHRSLDQKLEAGQEPTKAAVREVVLAAAQLGLRGTSRPSNRNPLYRAPTKAGAAWTHLYGACRALSEWGAEGENLALALRGVAERTDDQSSNIAAVRKCVATLNRFLEDL